MYFNLCPFDLAEFDCFFLPFAAYPSNNGEMTKLLHRWIIFGNKIMTPCSGIQSITLPFNEYQYTTAFLAKAECFGKIWLFLHLSTQLSNNG